MQNTTPPPARLQALDGLRALAILLVLGRHLPDQTVAAMPGAWHGFFATWQRGGWIGVDLFFVLSGFLVSGLLFREHQRFREIRVGHFLARRGFKIYPPFFAMLAIVIGISMWNGRPFPPVKLLLPEVLFFQNYSPAIFPHAWSLAVEEHFYLALPLVLLALGRGKGQPFARLPLVALFVALGALALRRVVADEPFSFRTHLFPTHLRIDSLFFGVFLAWLWHFRREALEPFLERWRWPLGVAAVALAAPAFLLDLGGSAYLHTWGFTGLYVSAGIVLLLALRRPLVWRPLAFIGAYSYSIYLWHMPIRLYLASWGPRDWPPLAQAGLFFALSVVIGIVAAWIVERPFLALRDRLLPTRSRPLAAAAPIATPSPDFASEGLVTQGR